MRLRLAFTLVEVMIVIMIIAVVSLIAVPRFLSARKVSQVNSCVANLRLIEAAKESWAMDHKGPGATPEQGDLVGSTEKGYLKYFPVCPGGGTYTIGNRVTRPTCSLAAEGHVID